MRNIRLTFAYDGTGFWGYQRQREGRTVQGELEKVLSQITDQPVTVFAAGRTDTGVHASGQVANFRSESSLSVDKIQKGVNALLPCDISVQKVEDVPETFHARFSAVSRRYEYTLDTAPVRSVFNRLYALHIPFAFDLETVTIACRHLAGEKDFSSFRGSNDMSEHSVRFVFDAGGIRRGEVVVLFFEASSFLQHMIRIIVGTLLAVGRGAMTADAFGAVVQTRNRACAGPTAPPHGLCLTRVRYSE